MMCPKDEFIQMYENAVQDGHLLIDKNKSDIRYKFRKNFSDIIFLMYIIYAVQRH